jgi:hypothetical protein
MNEIAFDRGEEEDWRHIPGAISDICDTKCYEQNGENKEVIEVDHQRMYETLKYAIRNGLIEHFRPNTEFAEFKRKCESFPEVEEGCYKLFCFAEGGRNVE